MNGKKAVFSIATLLLLLAHAAYPQAASRTVNGAPVYYATLNEAFAAPSCLVSIPHSFPCSSQTQQGTSYIP
jgi:hypothetical protein